MCPSNLTPGDNMYRKVDGFTLIELLVVVAIIGILSAVAITSYVGVQTKAARSEAYSNLESLRLLQEQVFAENNEYAPVGQPAPFTLSYTATDPPVVLTLEGELRGFRPGGCRGCVPPYGLNYIYTIAKGSEVTSINGVTTANPPTLGVNIDCFVAVATGVPQSRVCRNAANCDLFVIDCNNRRNF